MTWIAEHAVVFVYPDGTIAIGAPEVVSTGEARCAVVFEGRELAISGSTTLQALVLAIRFVELRLRDFVAKGGRVLDPADDSDVLLVFP